MKMNLERGDKCFVRLHTGEVVEAEYIEPSFQKKYHRILHESSPDYLLATEILPAYSRTCRLVYPVSEMKRQMRLQ